MEKDCTLIMVDNDPDDHNFIIQGLKLAGHFNYTSVFSGQELLDLLLKKDRYKDSETTDPDFILLDLNMPGLSGFQTLKLLKKDPELKKIPVYVLSTASHDHIVETAIALGAEHYYSKPKNISGYKLIFKEICTQLCKISVK